MVNPLNLPYSPENINHRTEFDNGTAIGMPPISFSSRKNAPITNVNNSYEYNPSHNSSRRYSKNLAPSGILTEAFFKSRVLLSPVFFTMRRQLSIRIFHEFFPPVMILK